MADNDMQLHENAQHRHVPDRCAAVGDGLPAVAPATFLPLIEAAKTQADYAAIYAQANAYDKEQRAANTWTPGEADTSVRLCMWLKMLAENGSIQQNLLDALADAVKHFKRVRGLA